MPFLSKHLPASLFWDVDFSKLDWDLHEKLIVQRVIERGSMKALEEIMERYGKVQLTVIIKKIKHLSRRDMAFVTLYFGIDINELTCYSRKLLIQN